jgi:hypothetical protein
MAIVKQRTEAAELLGVNQKSLGNWKNEPGFPDCSDGYDLDAIRKWRDERERKGSEADSQLATINKAIKLQKLEEIKRKNLLLQIAIDEKNSVLVPVSVVHDVLMNVAGYLREAQRQMQAAGHNEAAKLVDGLVIGRLKRLVDDKLKNK